MNDKEGGEKLVMRPPSASAEKKSDDMGNATAMRISGRKRRRRRMTRNAGDLDKEQMNGGLNGGCRVSGVNSVGSMDLSQRVVDKRGACHGIVSKDLSMSVGQPLDDEVGESLATSGESFSAE